MGNTKDTKEYRMSPVSDTSPTASALSSDVILPESYVWLSLGIVLVVTHGNEISAWSAVILFSQRSFTALLTTLLPPNVAAERRKKAASRPCTSTNNNKSATTTNNNNNNNAVLLWRIQGNQGLAILILTSLWTLVRPVGYKSNAWIIPWILANRDYILSWVLSSSSSSSPSPSPSQSKSLAASLSSSAAVVASGSLGLLGLWCHTAWQWYAPGKMLVAHFLGDSNVILRHVTALQQVFSVDEWQTFCFLAAGVWLQWMEEIVTKRQEGYYYYYYYSNLQSHPNRYSTLVACAGNIGIVWAASWVSSQRKTRWPLGLQVILLLVLPLALVEVSLYLVSVFEEDHYPTDSLLETQVWIPRIVPRCIRWLIHFLIQSEEPLWDTITPVPVFRFVWLFYWAAIVVMGIWAAPTRPSRVVTRKWFHGVSVLLFTPVTLYAPGLQSVGYAIAVAVLVALEGIRPGLPWLQQFYTRYLDPTKDGRGRANAERNGKPARDVVIISHTALILGCAMPLWCYQMASDRLSPVVPFVGIAVVGVGDACGAVVGKYFGQHRWSSWLQNLPKNNHRTVEGSIAMGISQVVFFGILGSWGIPVQWPVVSLPLVFATLLEAWTNQMDNLILPLAVTAFYGLWEQALIANA